MTQKQKFIIAVIITLTISVILFLVFGNAVINNSPITEQGRTIIGTIMGSLIAILGIIIGTNTKKNEK